MATPATPPATASPAQLPPAPSAPRPCRKCGQPLPAGCHRSTQYHPACKPDPTARYTPVPRKTVECRICATPFQRRSAGDLYCSDECRAQGLLRAIKRQTKRRTEAKIRREKEKAEGRTGGPPKSDETPAVSSSGD